MCYCLQSCRIIRERKRVAWILLILALLFAVCWMPLHIVTLISDIDPTITFPGRPYLLLLGHANSALNPVIYCIMSKNFRRSVKEVLCRGIIDFCTRSRRLRQRMQVCYMFNYYKITLSFISVECSLKKKL